jgi:plastocyanin
MRFYAIALATSAVVLGACAGGDKGAADTSAVKIDTAAPSVTPAPNVAPTGAAPAAGAVAPAAITGTIHEVKMIGDATGYKFDPANITIKAGDGIKFTVVGGGPHNVAFDPATVPPAAQSQLDANIPTKMGQLSSTLLTNAGESVTISFAKVAPGSYPYHCTPHLALGMKGVITIQ